MSSPPLSEAARRRCPNTSRSSTSPAWSAVAATDAESYTQPTTFMSGNFSRKRCTTPITLSNTPQTTDDPRGSRWADAA
jgi:hypothetical protein